MEDSSSEGEYREDTLGDFQEEFYRLPTDLANYEKAAELYYGILQRGIDTTYLQIEYAEEDEDVHFEWDHTYITIKGRIYVNNYFKDGGNTFNTYDNVDDVLDELETLDMTPFTWIQDRMW